MEETAGSKTWEATVECGCRIGGEPQGEAGEISRGFGATGVGVSTLHLILQEGATERRGTEPLLRGLAPPPPPRQSTFSCPHDCKRFLPLPSDYRLLCVESAALAQTLRAEKS